MSDALAAVFLGAVDLTVISTVLPRIVTDLQINTADIDRYIWVVNGYLLAYIMAIPLVGRLSDLVGRRFAFEAAILLFLGGSIWSGFAHNLRDLIAARAVQGAGGGALLPIAMAVAGDLFPRGQRTTALGVVGAVDTLGWVLGPIWGAAILALAGSGVGSWRWVFWVNVPIAIALAAVIHHRLPPRPRNADAHVRQRLDFFGALLLGSALVLFNLALSSGGEAGAGGGSAFRALGGTHNPLVEYLPWLLIGALLCLAAYAYWQRHAPSPLFPHGLFRDRSFFAAQIANFAVGAALVAAMVDVPLTAALLVAEDRVSLVSALLLAPFTLLMAAAALAGGVWAGRHGARATALVGLAMVVVGFVAVWAGLIGIHYLRMIPGLAAAGFGFGLVVAPVGSSAIDHAPASERGIAAASTILFRLLGMTVGLSALTAFGIHRLQVRSERIEPIVRKPDETTAEFFLRQTQFIQDVAIPMAIGVIRETFLLAALFAAVAMVPVLLMSSPPRDADHELI